MATRYALERAGRENLPVCGVQHHHAHIAACMAEHGLSGERPLIGIAFDGTGYGDDGAIWGGEFLLATYQGYERLAHLRYTPLPGVDAAARQPWRMALSWLHSAGIDWQDDLPSVQHAAGLPGPLNQLEMLQRMLRGLNPAHFSMGRLFDAAGLDRAAPGCQFQRRLPSAGGVGRKRSIILLTCRRIPWTPLRCYWRCWTICAQVCLPA
jgi:hydrogenase maturation protein HypF